MVDDLPADGASDDAAAARRMQELLVGVWAYGSKKVYTYEVDQAGELEALGAPANCLRFRQPLTKGCLSGILEPREAHDAAGGPWRRWMEASLESASGQPRGRIRLRPVEGQGVVVSSFLSPSAEDWGSETKAHLVPRPYLVDHGLMPRGAPVPDSLDLCRSRDLEDKDGTQVAWGGTVVGVELGDGWLRVADGQQGSGRFLPVRIGGARVLIPRERRWRCEPRDGRAVEVRVQPYFDGPLSGEEIRVGEQFSVTAEYKGADSILHLKLADGRGWVPVRHAYAGQLCKLCPDPVVDPGAGRRERWQAASANEERVLQLLGEALPQAPPDPSPTPGPPVPAAIAAAAMERPLPGKALGSSVGVVASYSAVTGMGFIVPDDDKQAEVHFGTEHLCGISLPECRSGLRVSFDKFDVAGRLRARNVRRDAAGVDAPAPAEAAAPAATAASQGAEAAGGGGGAGGAEAPRPSGRQAAVVDPAEQYLHPSHVQPGPALQAAEEEASRQPSAFDFSAVLGATIADLRTGETAVSELEASAPPEQRPSGAALAEAAETDMAACAAAALDAEAPPSPPVVLDRAQVLELLESAGPKAVTLAATPEEANAPATTLEEAIELRVHGLGGPICVVKASRCWTVRQVKKAVQEEAGIPWAEQRLLCGSVEPCEAEPLSCLPAGDYADLSLVRRRPEEAKWVAKAEDSWRAIEKAPEWVRSSHVIMYAVVQQAGYTLHFATEELRRDRSVVLAAVRQNGHCISCAAPELRADREVATAAVRESGLALQSVASLFGGDREVVGAAVKQNGLSLEHAAPALKGDSEVVLAAVRQNGLALQFASLKLRADAEVVTEAVQQNGLALRFAPQELRANMQVVLVAVRQSGLALEFAKQELRANQSLALAAVRQHKRALELVAPKLRADAGFLLAAVQENGLILQHASQALRSSFDVVLTAVKQNGLALQFAAQELRAARSVALAAVKQNGLALQFAEQDLRKDLRVVLAAAQQDEAALRFAAAKLEGTEKDLADWRRLNGVVVPSSKAEE